MTIVEFPNVTARRAGRRDAARKPRRSKNGTPEERAAAKANGPFRKVPFKPRRSKNGTPEERAAKKAASTIIELETVRPKTTARAVVHLSDYPTEPKAS
jgi:hypothetical protein